jgi:hypothetical protein
MVDDHRINRLTKAVRLLLQNYKHEIIESGDWWWGFRNYSLNIHDYGDYENTGWFSINVYKLDPATGMDNYSEFFDLAPMKLY